MLIGVIAPYIPLPSFTIQLARVLIPMFWQGLLYQEFADIPNQHHQLFQNTDPRIHH